MQAPDRSPQFASPEFASPHIASPRFLAVRVGDRVAVRMDTPVNAPMGDPVAVPTHPEHAWWIGDVIHAEGGARCDANSLFQIACVDSGAIRTVNADAVIDILQAQARAADAD